MAKAKLVKRKKRLRIDRLASMMMVLAICLFLGAKYGLQSYNYSLSLKKTQIEAKNKELSQAVADLQSEVTNLQSREHVLSVAEKDNIKTNQKNVTLIGDSKEYVRSRLYQDLHRLCPGRSYRGGCEAVPGAHQPRHAYQSFSVHFDT